jgi:hypothetical protein
VITRLGRWLNLSATCYGHCRWPRSTCSNKARPCASFIAPLISDTKHKYSLSPTAIMMAEKVKAAQLKEEGNKFYAQQDYEQAYAKYTEAITEDTTNAVLYANRAACSLAMKRQLFLFA